MVTPYSRRFGERLVFINCHCFIWPTSQTRPHSRPSFCTIVFMANGHSIPLLQFPNEKWSLVLRFMDGRALLLFSLISRKTKDIIKNSKWLKPRGLDLIPPLLNVQIAQPFSIAVIRPCVLLKFYKEPEHNMTMLEKPNKVWIWTVRRGLPPVDEMELPNPFTLAEWLKHLLYILNLSVPSQLSFLQNAELFDLGVVKSTFPKFNALRIGRVSAEHSENAFRTFLPDIKNLKISNPFNERDCRGREFEEVNQFLKLWIKGANPRLQELIIRQRTGFVPENIFEGVKITRVIPGHEEIRHNGVLLVSGGLPDRVAVDFKRFDGGQMVTPYSRRFGERLVFINCLCFIWPTSQTRPHSRPSFCTIVFMANGHSIPLLRLPNEKWSLVLRFWDGRELLLFSLISRKTKDIIKNSKWLKPRGFDLVPPLLNVKIAQPFTMAVIYPCVLLKFYKEPEHNMAMLEKPNKVWIWTIRRGFRRGDEIELPNSLTLAEWLQHLLYILNLSVPSQLSFAPNADLFDLRVVKSTFRKFETLRIGRLLSAELRENLLKAFLPVNLKISNPFNEGDCRFQKLLSQNFDSLKLDFSDNTKSFTLNDLLICNASVIEYQWQEFEEINQFLKLWIEGANPRLQELIIRQRTGFVPENIFKGVKIIRVIPVHEEIRRNGVLLFSGGLPDRVAAVDIKRFDGVRGTAVIYGSSFYLFSWNF
ncbi:unnamed protein product [Caenorhabditis brenneri]